MLRVARKIPWYSKWTVRALHICSALAITALMQLNITGAFESEMALAVVVPLYELYHKRDTTDSQTVVQGEPAVVDRKLYRSRDSPRDVDRDRVTAIAQEPQPFPSIGASGLTVLLLAGVVAMLCRLSK